MARKVLIAPVGIYKQRVWKSIVRSGADKVYLISDSKPDYEITADVAHELEEQTRTNLTGISIVRREADFADIRDIYRAFVAAIERERAENPYVEITLDATSTTKEAYFAACNLAISYDLEISYVPGAKKTSEKIVRQRFEMEKGDPGGQIRKMLPTLWIPKGNPLREDHMRVLCKIVDNSYNSINDLVENLGKDEGVVPSDAYKKRFLRSILDLEQMRLVRSKEIGRVKLIAPTDEGKGIARGIKEAARDLERNGIKPVITSHP